MEYKNIAEISYKLRKRQRSGFDTIKFHTKLRTPNGKISSLAIKSKIYKVKYVKFGVIFRFYQQSIDFLVLNTGSYLSVPVLLNELNEFGKRDKMRGLPSILSYFRNEFNKFNKTGARMLDSI